MSRRTRTTAALLVLLLALVVVAPALPVVRDAVVRRALAALESSDVSVTYRSTSGNAWRGITLHDVDLRGLGADAHVETLTIGYFLPSLLGGELPIDVLVHGATGDVDVKRLLDASVGDNSGGGGGSISVRLRKIDLQEIGVSLAQVPFTLPDANIDSFSVTQDGAALDLAATLTTAEGSASVTGRYDALTGTFTGHVDRADATIARHWWDGVTAGNVTGDLTIRGNSIDGDFILTGGAVDDLGLTADNVSGTVALRYPIITTELIGDTFGGQVEATGVVNITAKRWEAHGGGTADLGAAADWLVRSVLPDGLPLPTTGTVQVDLNLVGWEEIALQGSATGAGTVADMPLEALEATFGVAESGDLSVTAHANLGGGPVALTIGPDVRGERVAANLAGVGLAIGGRELGTLNADLDMATRGAPAGTLSGDWQMAVADRMLTAQVDANLDADGWQFYVTGQDDLGSSAEGAAVLADGVIQGSFTVRDIAGMPLSPGAGLTLSASGPLDALRVTLALQGDGPVSVAAGPPELRLIDDLHGSVSGTLAGTGISDLSGAFGPIGVGGTVELSPVSADLRLTVDETTVAYGDTARATLTVEESHLTLDSGALSWTGTVLTPGVTVGPAFTAPGPLTATATFGGGSAAGDPAWRASLASTDGTLLATIDPGGFAVELAELELTGTGPSTPVAALVSGTIAPVAGAADSDAERPATLAIDLRLAAGSTLGPASLADDLAVSGTIDLGAGLAHLTGETGEVGIDLVASLGSASEPSVTAKLSIGPTQTLDVSFDPTTRRFSLEGGADTAALMAALGVVDSGALSAVADVDLAGMVVTTSTGTGLAELNGAISLSVAEPLLLSATLTGSGSELVIAASGGTDGLPLNATGTLDLSDFSALTALAEPASAGAGSQRTGALDVTLGPLEGISLTSTGASGSGTLDLGSVGPIEVAPLNWNLTAQWLDVDAPYATLSAGDSAVTVTLADGQLWLSGAARLPLAYAGQPLEVAAIVAADGGRVPLTDLTSIPVTGALNDATDGSTLVSFTGTMADLTASGSVPAALLAAPLPAAVTLTGELTVDANIDLTAGPDYSAALTLATAGASLAGSVTGSGADLRAELSGEDLEISYGGDTLSVTANHASVAPFLAGNAGPAADTIGTLDGTLTHDPAGGWRGSLVADLALPLSGSALSATAALLGEGDSLGLAAQGTGPLDSSFTVAGPLTPDLSLTAEVTALDDGLAANLSYRQSTGLTGTVTSRSYQVDGYGHLPAQAAELTWLPGTPLRLVGDGIDVTADLSDSAAPLSGSLDLDLTLLGEAGRLTAELGGSLAAPSADLEVHGPGLSALGSGSLSEATAALSIEEPALTRLLPELAAQYVGLVEAPVTATAHWSADTGWAVTANSLVGDAGSGASGGIGPATLDLDVTGDGADYSGGLQVSLGGRGIATVAINGAGADLRADLDLGTVQWAALAEIFGVDIDVVGGGHASFTTAPLDAKLDVDMAGTAGGLAATLQGSAPNDLSFTLTGTTETGSAVDLSGRLAWNEEERVLVTGTVGDQTVDARLTLDDALTTGRLVVDVPGANLVADLKTPSRPNQQPGTPADDLSREVALNLALDGSAFGGLAGTVNANVLNQGGVTTLVDLAAATTSLPGLGTILPLELVASGVLAPLTAVAGTVTAPTLGESATLRAAQAGTATAPAGTVVELTWGDLLAAFDIASSQLTLTGTAELGHVAEEFLPESLAGLSAAVTHADLGWSPSHGFSGSLAATLDAPALQGTGIGTPLNISATAVDTNGSGDDADHAADLGVSLTVDTNTGTRLGTVALTVPADPFGATALAGTLDIDADLADLLDLPQVALRLSGAGTIGGTLSAPTLDGTLDLSGDVTATGSFSYAPDPHTAVTQADTSSSVNAPAPAATAGTFAVDLSGPELTLSARTDGASWTADAVVERLSLAGWVPQVANPYLSFTARADSAGSARATVEHLVIESDNSRLTGAATIDTGVRVLLQAQVDLADVKATGTELQGLLRGPVIVTAPSLDALSRANVTAQLDAAGVGVDSLGASVSGTMQLIGSLADPVINAVLRGNGDLSGGLRVDAAPNRGRLQVRSDLSLGALDSDFDVSVDNGATRARGQLRFGEAVLFISDDAGGVSLTGAGLLDGWTVGLAPDLAGASLTGPLARLLPGNTGAVDISVGDGGPSHAPRRTDEPWLRGTLTGLAVGGQALGDLVLTSAEPGAPLTLVGDNLNASYALDSNDWTLRLTGQELPGDLVVDLSGHGAGLNGSLAGTLRGTGSLPVDLQLAVDVADDLTVTVTGQALGGVLDMSGRRAGVASGDWTGTVTLNGAAYGGMALDVDGPLFGSALVPSVVLTTSAQAVADEDSAPSFSLNGLLSAGPSGITVDQTVAVPALDSPLRVRGRVTAPTDLLVMDDSGASWRVQGGGSALRASGRMSLDVGPATVTLGATGTAAVPTLRLALASTPTVALSTTLVGSDLMSLLSGVATDGLKFEGEGPTRGSIAVELSPTPRAVLRGLGLELGGFDIEADGAVTATATDVSGHLVLPAEVPTASERGALRLPFYLSGDARDWHLESSSALGSIAADLDLATMAAEVAVDLALGGANATGSNAGSVVERGITSGAIVGHLSYDPQTGATGSFAIADVVLAPAAVGSVTVNADVAVANGRVSGTAGIDTTGGRVALSGEAALAELLPSLELPGLGGATGSNLELRIRTLDLGLIPGIATAVPHLDGALSGVVQLRNGVILGQLVAPELSVGERLLPASLQLSGVPSSIDAALIVAGTLISGDLEAGRLTGSARLERFPLELVAEAFVGPSDVTAALTGVLRFDVPLSDADAGFVRLATEEIRLERAGVVTIGNVTLTYDDRALDIERAEFGGRGRWQASGVLSPDQLDFRLEAENADFSPLLGLFPDLALYAVGAAGSFTFTANGDFGAPHISLVSDALDIGFAGTRYRMENTAATLDGVDLSVATRIRGLDPLQGALDFSGDATVMLDPLALRYVDFGFSGSLSVPGFGVLEDISGVINQDEFNNPAISLSGVMGAPVNVAGTLVPLDLRAGGTGLTLSFPALMIGEANVALDLRLRGEDGGVTLGGSVMADEIILDLGAGSEPSEPSSPTVESAAASALSSSDQVSATEAQGARNALAALRFDDLRITAPQRVLLAMNIANIEAALDLTVSGTAADPRLTGTAEALRGNLRFSGREFTFSSGVATFSASRGVLPELAIAATTEFEKSRVLTGSQGVRFVSPSDGQTFSVNLAITGPVESAPPEEGGFRFDVRPILTSDALVEIEGEGVGTGVRGLTEAELLSLITLGRVDFQSGLLGAGGLSSAVAQGALDTAVDLLIVGELQNALREALGLDVVEIRTSAISSLLDGDADQFGVSVRLGGYLNPELFASYRIGTADPGDPAYALTNEVALSYGLGPLDLDLFGRIDFPSAGTLGTPRPELGVGLRYDFGRALGLDAGVTLSTQRSVVSFGVALRW